MLFFLIVKLRAIQGNQSKYNFPFLPVYLNKNNLMNAQFFHRDDCLVPPRQCVHGAPLGF